MFAVKTNIKIIIFVLFLLVFASVVYAQTGLFCCCRQGVAQQASPIPDKNQCQIDFPFFEVSAADITIPNVCLSLCQSVQPSGPFCGNGVVEAGEECDDGNILSGDGCTSNCHTEIVEACGAPGYKPTVENLLVSPVKGEKSFKITFDRPCPVESVSVSRCKGFGCTDFKVVALLSGELVFVDDDPVLEWKTDYTYRVVANYVREGPSTAVDRSANLGDLECWQQTTSDVFCISEFYYEKFRGYLSSFGYAGIKGSDFSEFFSPQIVSIFSSRFNVAWKCDDKNSLNREFACAQNDFCVSDEKGARCVTPSECDNVNPFGLYSSIASCEGSSSDRKFCFLDRSIGPVNSCIKCSQKMSCYDYKLKGSCERDNCGIGECVWKPVFNDLGTGVCVDSRVSNCHLCSQIPSPDSPTKDAFNAFFDQCSPVKAAALSTSKFSCFSVKEDGKFVAKSCDNAVCHDFTERQCGSPTGGVTLNPDNSLSTKSTDACGIGVCQFVSSSGCFKNADATPLSQIPFEDCKIGGQIDKSCERDYSPPVTTVVGAGKKSRFDGLAIMIRDSVVKNGPVVNSTGKPGYETYLCVTSNSSCTDFSRKVNVSRLTIKNLELKLGNNVLFNLKEGNNNVFFFSKDPAKNVELVKKMSFIACFNCSIPEIVNVSVTGGRFFNNKFFTAVKKPTISVAFDEEVTVNDVFLLEQFNAIPLTKTSGNLSKVHSFVPNIELEGVYNFSINVKNKNNVFIDEVYTFTIVVDTSQPVFISSPAPEDVLKNVKDVMVVINASKLISVKNIYLVEEKYEDYFKRKVAVDKTNLFKSVNNKSFAGRLSGFKEGKQIIRLVGEDFAGMPVYHEFFFVVANSQVNIMLKSPGFGLASADIFNLSVETSSNALCRYVFGLPFAPSNASFDQFIMFDITNNRFHTAPNFDKLKQNLTQVHVYCKNDFGVSQESFMLGFDKKNPSIVSAFAVPNVISETALPGEMLFSTTLKIITNELGYCKYSPSISSFDAMIPFPGYEEEPKSEHLVQVNVSEIKSYSFNVICVDRAGLRSELKQIPVSIDLSRKLEIASTTSPFGNSTSLLLTLSTNKRAICILDDNPFEPKEFANSHFQYVSVNGSGVFEFPVMCSNIAGEQASAKLKIIVDESFPLMLFVNDSSIYKDPSISFFKDKIRVAFKGEDEESNVTKYVYSLVELLADKTVIDETESTVLDGSFITITKDHEGKNFNLTDGVRYAFKVYAINGVGSASDVMVSDGVLVDSSKFYIGCDNRVVDANESDVDCGRICGPTCKEGQLCIRHSDCQSGVCVSGACAKQSCNDDIFSPFYESDTDCGKSCSEKCDIGESCLDNKDCFDNTCINGVCRSKEICLDGEFTPDADETGTDCGGSCPSKCGEGQGCLSDKDCFEGLSCGDDKLCHGIDDADGDGVADASDTCAKTPKGESVDKEGCGPSQKDSDKDGMNDAFEIKYNLDANDPSDALVDFDKDEFTNLEEFKKGTSPINPDTDGDNWKDGVEVKKGYDPLNPVSHPTSIVSVLLKVFMYLLLLVILGVVGYLIYDKLVKKKAEAALFKPLDFKALPSFKHRHVQFKPIPGIKPGRSAVREERKAEKLEEEKVEEKEEAVPVEEEKESGVLGMLRKIAKGESKPAKEEPKQKKAVKEEKEDKGVFGELEKITKSKKASAEESVEEEEGVDTLEKLKRIAKSEKIKSKEKKPKKSSDAFERLKKIKK